MIEVLKEIADRYKILLRYILNIILTLFVGMSGLIYSLTIKTITVDKFIYLSLPLLIIFLKLVIIVIIIWKKLDKLDDEILANVKEK